MHHAEQLRSRLHVVPMQVGDTAYQRDESVYCSYAICQQIPAAERDAFVAQTIEAFEGDRAVGCLVGMAIADALGHPLEFLPVTDQPGGGSPYFDLERMYYESAVNRFRLQPGQWTDDAAMGLCIADSLIIRRQYDGSDIRSRFWNWWYRGYNNAFRNDPARVASVGLGGNISKSLSALVAGAPPPPRYQVATEDAGVGSLMRLAALPLHFHRDTLVASQAGRESSFTTHPGHIAAEACAFLSFTIARAIRQGCDGDAKSFLDAAAADYLTLIEGQTGRGYDQIRALLQSSQPDDSLERCWNWKAPSLDISGTLQRRGPQYNGYEVLPDYFGAYCMDGLAVALHSVYHTHCFDEAVVRCINFLGDADSTGAIAGQLAGALYGLSSVHPKLREQLRRWDDGDIAFRGALLYGLAVG